MSDARHPLSAAERLDWLRLIRSENVGPITFYRIMERFGSAAAALDALPALARRGGRGKAIKVCPKAEAEREIEAAVAAGAQLLANGEPGYPSLLSHIEDAPPLISVRGHAHLLEMPAVAVVGARNASLNGRRVAESIAGGLGEAGMAVVSGLARGIDVVYPKENAALHDAIAEQGVLISEMAPGTVPQARHFPRRNRLISGLALGVVVVEASLRSGSLITARLALEQGREVFAVPGSPLDPRARGPNDMIRQGAILVESAEDVKGALSGALHHPLAEGKPLDFKAPSPEQPSPSELDKARTAIEKSLGPAPLLVDEIVRNDHFSPALVSMVLLELELAGRVERHPGNQVSLVENR